MTTFAYPWVLLLYIPFAALVIYIWRRPMPTLKMSSIKPFKTAGAGGIRPAVAIPKAIFTASLALLILALARPRHGDEKVILRAQGIDIMLALDLSGSMEAIDVPGKISTEKQLVDAIKSGKVKKRLSVAKDEIIKFIEKRPNDRIGLVGFANLPYSACPPTLDHAWLIQNMNRLEPGVIGDKTGIAGPIASAVQRLKNSDSKRRVIVLFTDGSNNVDARVSPRQAAKLAKEFNIIIYTVGIGSDRAFALQRGGFFGNQFVPIQGEFDEGLLKDIAKTSEGKYYKAADSKGLEKVMDEINKMEKTSVEQPKYIEYSEFGPKIIVASLMLLLLGIFLDKTFCLKIP